MIDRAKFAINEFVEATIELQPRLNKIDAEVSFDEFTLNFERCYDGELMELAPATAAESGATGGTKGP